MPLRNSATELLLTDRYVDEDPSFYGKAEEYWDDIVALNDQLNLWEQSPNETQKWLGRYQSDHIKKVNRFNGMVGPYIKR